MDLFGQLVPPLFISFTVMGLVGGFARLALKFLDSFLH